MAEGEFLFSKELDVAVRVVHLACALCQRVQNSLLSTNASQVNSKDDDSLVTVADYSVQAVVSQILSESFGSQNLSIVAEEDAQTLSKSDLLQAVVNTVNESFSEAPRKTLVLDPVDGTLGFVRGNQYAVALALIEEGRVILGVLGCPNYPVKKGLVNHHHQLASEMSSASPDMWEKGCVMKKPLRVYSMVKYAAIARGDAEIYMRFATAGYKEKIWDHAAGVLIVQEAGGVVTDAGGRPLDFSRGVYLEGLDRGIIACSGAVLHEKIIGAVDTSWNALSCECGSICIEEGNMS
uniref:3'(2'),5'-bisphosphate nucleotidase n=1 Tax=Chenopodium quinoa TaxID=63459 RepID=A0A803MH76_CHEQI